MQVQYPAERSVIIIIIIRKKMNILAYMWSWRLTTLAKLSVDVSDVVSHELSRKGLHSVVML